MAIVARRSSAPLSAYRYPARLRKRAVCASFPFFGQYYANQTTKPKPVNDAKLRHHAQAVH
jgi:hypothetical protein